jgi:hypothetical protein
MSGVDRFWKTKIRCSAALVVVSRIRGRPCLITSFFSLLIRHTNQLISNHRPIFRHVEFAIRSYMHLLLRLFLLRLLQLLLPLSRALLVYRTCARDIQEPKPRLASVDTPYQLGPIKQSKSEETPHLRIESNQIDARLLSGNAPSVCPLSAGMVAALNLLSAPASTVRVPVH